ncbi:isochorismatase family protein [Rubrivivax gelatinosus]|uniref:Putative isochorismatase hydrolase family protein n=1 Tax=Rubrivivax gelatinosus (strain NBRC 100245 / IL144) TaxID=983917 RepID=I0HVB4_RUBGI|nr:isochorismatase family protein [Rubrivivax gelatinosus]BAL96951.1 putative isochorismatase hydrolase family protein [Rubrivivax gelatinosus IL144]
MQAMDRASSALVLVDYQGRLMPAIDDGAHVLAWAQRLAEIARELAVPVLGTEQNPAKLGPNDEALRALCDTTLAKTHFDACADGLVEALRALPRAPRQIVVAGCEAHVCLLQTALGLCRAGYEVFVVEPACGSRAAEDKVLAMARLRQAGAVIVSVEMVAFEWLHDCRDPAFRRVLPLLKQRVDAG